MNSEQDIPFDEKTLVNRAQHGDNAAFRDIYEQFKQNIAASIYKITNNTHDTDELLQDTFVIAFNKLNTFRGNGSLEGWLRRIAVNCTLGMIRKRKKLSIVDPAIIASNREHRSTSDNTCPSTALEHSEFKTDFQSALLKLDEPMKEAFCLAVLERKPYSEISRLLGISLSLVKIRVYRARKQLQSELSMHIQNFKGDKS